MTRSMRPWLITLLKLTIAAALVTFLFNQGTLDFSMLLEGPISIPATLIGLALFLLTFSFSAIRWHQLLKIQGGFFPFPWVLRVTFIGMFLNYFLPGSISGDAMRMAYTHRASRRNRGALIISVAMDKIFGLYSLSVICLMASLFHMERILASEPLTLLFSLSLLLVISAPVATGLIWFLTRPGSRMRDWLKKSPKKNWDRFIHLMVRSLRSHAWNLSSTFLALLTSIVSQGFAVAAMVWVAHAADIGDLPSLQYAIACTWGWIAAIIPITPGGLGISEAAFDQVCRWFDPVASPAPYATIFLTARFLAMAATLPGLLAYLTHRNEIHERGGQQPPETPYAAAFD